MHAVFLEYPDFHILHFLYFHNLCIFLVIEKCGNLEITVLLWSVVAEPVGITQVYVYLLATDILDPACICVCVLAEIV